MSLRMKRCRKTSFSRKRCGQLSESVYAIAPDERIVHTYMVSSRHLRGMDMSDSQRTSQPQKLVTLLDLVAAAPGREPAVDGVQTALGTLGPSVGEDNSDVRLKTDIERVGTTVFGLPLYHFKYIDKPETYEGVMAQDVLDVMPQAVELGADGYYRVSYRALGIAMRRVL